MGVVRHTHWRRMVLPMPLPLREMAVMINHSYVMKGWGRGTYLQSLHIGHVECQDPLSHLPPLPPHPPPYHMQIGCTSSEVTVMVGSQVVHCEPGMIVRRLHPSSPAPPHQPLHHTFLIEGSEHNIWWCYVPRRCGLPCL